jgi:GTP pyrophosphokinase
LREREARETQEIYAPLANRLGIWQIKWELEDLSLRYLHPGEYREIARQLDGRRADREQFIGSVIELLQQQFREAGVEAEVTGRPKHIYSIWRKMKRKAVDIDQIFDLRAVRVLVDTLADCYAALGVVHGIWRHIPGEFDDYIATPKPNMYRSIHTAVIGPDDKTLEIQIRTHEMHQHSELGVAAHWRYKESSRADAEFERRIILMRSWLEAKGEGDGAGDFTDDLRAGFDDRQIYVFSPNGKVVELPRGATPVDFAYAIHSSVGHRCRGARINGSIAPLAQPLKSGQTVEILTGKQEGPSRDWLSPHLGYLKTSRARNRVRHWFKHQDYAEHLNIGRASLEREITRLSVARPDLEKAAERFNFQKPDDLLAAIGRGDVSPVQVAGMGASRKPVEPATGETPLPARQRNRKTHSGRGAGEVVVEGVGDLLTHMARCCKPVPYDDIVGFITRGRGVTVHRRDCSVIGHLQEEERLRLVEVVWAQQTAEASYPVDIRVVASDRKGLLRDISSIFTNDEVDVIGVNTQSDHKMDRASMRFTIEIKDMHQLSRLLDKIAQLPNVNDVRRQA